MPACSFPSFPNIAAHRADEAAAAYAAVADDTAASGTQVVIAPNDANGANRQLVPHAAAQLRTVRGAA